MPIVLMKVTASDGSSSMASVCGTSLAASYAQYPIDAQVAGVAIGAYINEYDPKTEGHDEDHAMSNTLLGKFKSLIGFNDATSRTNKLPFKEHADGQVFG